MRIGVHCKPLLQFNNYLDCYKNVYVLRYRCFLSTDGKTELMTQCHRWIKTEINKDTLSAPKIYLTTPRKIFYYFNLLWNFYGTWKNHLRFALNITILLYFNRSFKSCSEELVLSVPFYKIRFFILFYLLNLCVCVTTKQDGWIYSKIQCTIAYETLKV